MSDTTDTGASPAGDWWVDHVMGAADRLFDYALDHTVAALPCACLFALGVVPAAVLLFGAMFFDAAFHLVRIARRLAHLGREVTE